MNELSSIQIKQAAFDVGFDLCGISSAQTIPQAAQRFNAWLDNRFHGEMAYLEKEPERRVDPQRILNGANSVIMLGLNYYQPDSKEKPISAGRISKYARGRDYHKVIAKKLKALAARLTHLSGLDEATAAEAFRWYVDYGPMLERAYAVQAGLGYIGKNSMLINRSFGSYFFLAEIITTFELKPDNPQTANHGRCGDCNRCIDACPTGAIVADGVIDSTRCISYLTIERPANIPESLAKLMGDNLFGCDICQDVCPHNGRANLSKHGELLAGAGVGEFIDSEKILSLQSREDFLKLTAGTPLTRPKLEGLQRNAKIVSENVERESA
ncbi:MAG: tRNA epoxyqueuosine(34) reductase QueG [candidate division Zixibacteria bacterium]|nr:tRNA epoxyqueuosine(34) reductase QueG [candidate division Zixibacteria bacterium]